jgi:hypothetical protein
LADYYELLVKEYLEQQGFVVRLNVRFRKKKGYSDIDVLAFNCNQGTTILGEVKAASLRQNEIKKEDEDFNDPYLADKVNELIGQTNFEKCIFCWSVEDEVKKLVEEYKIKVIQFFEIINFLIEKVVSSRKKNRWIYDQSYPNTMLLQMLYHFSKPQNGKVRIQLDKLIGK